ncbi:MULTISPECIES: S1C family serine protease [unclassified Aureispira]|uniref:S1C family serine protease n=1 Tax=unclassified Aureispira TaxID=2649989 RepID=UPI0006987D62|nr:MULTISPECIES: trypsin-like peptidase domain-containing protein [unclassified Aureispira]WMX13257.1 trypsin-like peptidase domain-containing protein [Aureispira sp. CCB-E]
MKNNLVSLVLASAMGGAMALGGSYLLNPPTDVQTIQVSTEQQPVVQQPAAQKLVHNQGTLGRPESFADAADRAMPAVVNITSITEHRARNERERRYYQFFGSPGPSKSTGSGVIISEKGYIVTNNHVIKDATKVDVLLSDNRKFEAEVMGTDPSTDLAVLKITGDNLPVIDLANSDEARVGEWVLAIGNPFELSSTVTAGIISAKGRDISILNGQYSIESFIQTDAAVNPGNSGGALVNADGKLIGINTAIYAPSGTYAGYSFAVPINLVKKVMQDLIDHGEVKRAFLGIMIQSVDSDMAKELDLAVTEGVYVSELIEGGAAIQSELNTGDVITRINGIQTSSVPKLQEQIGSKNPGDDIVVTVNRRGQPKDIVVKLKTREE